MNDKSAVFGSFSYTSLSGSAISMVRAVSLPSVEETSEKGANAVVNDVNIFIVSDELELSVHKSSGLHELV